MGRITSNVGLITGIPIAETVDQLIQVAAAPRDLLISRTQGLLSERTAITSLSSRLVGLQFDIGKLKVPDPFEAKSISSSDKSILEATLATDGKPSTGNFRFRTVQTASAQQLVSQRFESVNDIQSTGSFSFGYGGFVDRGISLDELNSGAGVARGEIKLVDQAGNLTTIDLTAIQSVDDVIDAINSDTTTNLVASADGDSFVLTDTVGGAGTISVQEVGGGSTAADLGLTSLNIVGTVATGQDVYTLHSDTKLSNLNDGNGVRLTAVGVVDLTVTLADSTSVDIDLGGSVTLGNVIDKINAASDDLSAQISSDGNRIEVTDSSSGDQSLFAITSATGSAAEGLGLTTTQSGGIITGERVVSGLKDSLLSSLNGGAGLGTLGRIQITDRNSISADIDLSTAETLDEVVDLINNAAGIDVTATINSSRNGILITDDTGQSNQLVVASLDANNSAEALGIVVSDQVGSVNSGSLNLQTLSEATTLASLGITPNDIRITDTNGSTTSINLNESGAEAVTIGDVIDAINSTNAAVTASINSTGDGVLITDTAGGSQPLGISDVSGTLAEQLNLTRASTTVTINNVETQVIDGSTNFSVDLSTLDVSDGSIALSSVNNGDGIEYSDIRFTDSDGKVFVLDLNGVYSGVTTVGQVIDAINAEATASGAGVTASLNDSQTGIVINDTAGGDSNLLIEDINGTAAADLKILSSTTTTNQVDGIGLFDAQDASEGALNAVADHINTLSAGVTASVFFDGAGYRLSLAVDETGSANEILVDLGDSGFEFDETASAQDAIVILGEQAVAGSGVLLSSADNTFNQVIQGVDLTVASASSTSVTVTVESTDSEVIEAVQGFVDAYNAIRSELDEQTVFDEEALTTGVLFGTNEALRVETSLSRLITDRYTRVGSFESLADIGIEVNDSGELSLVTSKLQEAFTDDPASLEKLFRDETDGVVARFNQSIEQLAGADNGLLTNRNDALQNTIDLNNARIEDFDTSLDRQRESLLLEFAQLESLIATLQTNQAALNALQPLAPLVSVSS